MNKNVSVCPWSVKNYFKQMLSLYEIFNVHYILSEVYFLLHFIKSHENNICSLTALVTKTSLKNTSPSHVLYISEIPEKFSEYFSKYSTNLLQSKVFWMLFIRFFRYFWYDVYIWCDLKLLYSWMSKKIVSK